MARPTKRGFLVVVFGESRWTAASRDPLRSTIETIYSREHNENMKPTPVMFALLAVVLNANAADLSPRSFSPTIANSSTSPGPVPEGMVWIPGGEFSMGSEGKCDVKSCCSPATVADALPIHRVYVDGFWMDATDVTNAEFEKFVKATGYITIAERAPTKEEFPTSPPENLVAGSVVFTPTSVPVSLDDYYHWWSCVQDTNLRHPTGAQSSIKG